MASPMVAGAAALILDANNKLSSHTVKMLLQFTARVLPGTDALTQGAGARTRSGAVRLAGMITRRPRPVPTGCVAARCRVPTPTRTASP